MPSLLYIYGIVDVNVLQTHSSQKILYDVAAHALGWPTEYDITKKVSVTTLQKGSRQI